MTTQIVVTIHTGYGIKVAVFPDLNSATVAALRELGSKAQRYNNGMMYEADAGNATAYLTLVNDTNFSDIY